MLVPALRISTSDQRETVRIGDQISCWLRTVTVTERRTLDERYCVPRSQSLKDLVPAEQNRLRRERSGMGDVDY
jgi:hypothetical protein